MKRLMRYIKQFKGYMLVGPFFKLLESLSDLLNPLLVAMIIDKGIASGDVYYIVKIGLIILAINIMALVFSIIGQKCSSLASTKIAAKIRQDMFNKIASFSHTELDHFGTASLVNRITNDVNRIENAIGVFIRLILRTPLLLIGAFIMSFTINTKVSLIFLAVAVLITIIMVFYTKKTTPMFKRQRDSLDNISRVTRENLSGTRVIRAFNKQEFEQARFEETDKRYTNLSIRIATFSALLHPMVSIVVDVAIVGILSIGAWQINVGGMSTGDVIALIDYISTLTIAMLAISSIIAMFVRTYASVSRINEVLAIEPKVKTEKSAKNYKNLTYDKLMEFKNVCFNYTQSKDDIYFIKDLSFDILPKQTIGIIGGTGSGKSTIASLMARFYDVTDGEILYKGKNIKDFTLQQLRHEISIVQQRSKLFSGTLRDNMQLRNIKATDEEIVQALKTSQAWDFVKDWNNTLDHKIMAGGKNVSGGQMQRLTIARALIDKPEMLILDDSSSALDFLTDSKLRKAIKELDLTTVIISQRATSIKNADLIIVLDNGNVVGMGKHASLMKNCEIYKEIYDSQAK